MPCVAHLGEVARGYEELQTLGVSVVAVAHAPPEVVKAFLAREPKPYPMLSDPDRSAYRLFELGRVSFWHFLRPRIVANFIGLLFRGEKIRRLTNTEDIYQLGGDFILNRSLEVVFAYPSRDATDRVGVDAIREAVRSLKS